MTPSAPPETGQDGWMNQLGAACLRALAVVALAAIPTALRTSGAGGNALDGLLVGMGVTLPPVLVALLLSRAASRGFRQLVGAGSPRPAMLGLALWLGITTPLLVMLGAALKATTHHRGLGGGTFGVLALAVAAAAALLAQRLVSLGRTLVERGVPAWIPAAVGAAVGVLPLVAVALPLSHRGDDPGAAAVRTAIIDGAILLVATALAGAVELGAQARRAARLAGVPVAIAVILVALLRIESSPPLARAMRSGGGLAATILGALESWTDRDNDGIGAHFGGDDCDEGDPSRHPGAPEIPGDGIDQDCDGIDPPKPVAVVAASTATAVTVGPQAARDPGGLATRALDPAPPSSAPPGAPAPAHPDIVVVTLDTVRADHTSVYGYPTATTPRLAELAAKGVVFEHAYAAGGDAQRALAPIATGKHLSETKRDKREYPTLLAGNDMIAERLKRGGYRTAAVTSFPWLSQERGFSQGFDYFRPIFEGVHAEHEVTGDRAVRAALTVWKELESDPHPIFLWIHLFDAHERYLEHPGFKFKTKTGAYDGEIGFVDEKLGEIMSTIAGSPRGAHVAWIVHGSEGEGFEEHDFHGHAGEVYEEAIHVPLVIALPDGKVGRYEKAAVGVIDVPATVVDLAGAAREGLAGVSLAPIVRGDFAATHPPVYTRSQKKVALIDWPLKLMAFEKKKNDRLFLFDLVADPGEKKDLSRERTAEVDRLQKERAGIETASK